MQPASPERPASPDELTLPCFPLPLGRAALPGTQRILNVREPRYVEMVQSMLLEGKRHFVVPRLRLAWGKPPSRGVELAEAAVLFALAEVRDAPAGASFRYVCVNDVDKPVRIREIVNPEAYADGRTYLLAACEEQVDDDLGTDFRSEERRLLDSLHTIVRLRDKAGDPLRRLEMTIGANNQPFVVDNFMVPTLSEDSLGVTGVSRDSLWDLAGLWQGYCDRHVIARRQRLQRDAKGMDDEQAADLRWAFEAESKEVTSELAELMQGLLQADGYGSRLALLQEAADAEGCRLGAIAALQAMSRPAD